MALYASALAVVLLILVMEFFEYALRPDFHTPLDLLYLALGTVLVPARSG